METRGEVLLAGSKIPLNLPLQRETFNSPIEKGGTTGEFKFFHSFRGSGGFWTNEFAQSIEFSKVKMTLTLP